MFAIKDFVWDNIYNANDHSINMNIVLAVSFYNFSNLVWANSFLSPTAEEPLMCTQAFRPSQRKLGIPCTVVAVVVNVHTAVCLQFLSLPFSPMQSHGIHMYSQAASHPLPLIRGNYIILFLMFKQ